MDRYDAFTAMDRIGKASTALCRPDSLEAIWQGSEKGEPMPSLEDMKEILDRLSVALFPGFFGSASFVFSSSILCLSFLGLNPPRRSTEARPEAY